MRERWIFPDTIRQESEDVVIRLMQRRGIREQASMEEFLSEKPQLTHDPMLLKGMKESAGCLLSFIKERKQICIYGDYDADGVCAVSLLFEILNRLSDVPINWYIPSRFEEGYGLNCEAIDAIKTSGADLIVTVDCGSVSPKEVSYAKSLGMEVIVTDHHNLNENPSACLMINPKQKDCSYPDRDLCGCGVAFKLAQALHRLSIELPEFENRLTKNDLSSVLDLVAIATIGDIVPVLGENRTLIKYGIRTINSGKRPGLQELMRQAGLPVGKIKSDAIAYGVVPHLNAGGRMQTAQTGVRLLTALDEASAKADAAELVRNNRERKRIQEEDFKTARALAVLQEESPILIIESPDAHEGIAGIVAGKLKETFYKPTLILTPVGETHLKGTGRSVDGLDLYRLLSVAAPLFEKFGGHAGACGFLIQKDRLPSLRKLLKNEVEDQLRQSPDLLVPKVSIDSVLTPEELNLSLVRRLEALEPYGQRNAKPLLCLQNLMIKKMAPMGEHGQHLRFTANGIACVLFGKAAEYRDVLESGCAVDLCGYADLNRWNGSEKIQFVVQAVRCYNE